MKETSAGRGKSSKHRVYKLANGWTAEWYGAQGSSYRWIMHKDGRRFERVRTLQDARDVARVEK